MNKKNLIAGILFLSFVFILTINFWEGIDSIVGNELFNLSLLGILSSYVVVYFIYVVIFQHYSKWKIFFYDKIIQYIRESLKRQKGIFDDLGNIVFLSILVNFFSTYFLLITTPNQIISRIPGFEGINLFAEESDIDIFGLLNEVTRLDYFLPLTVIGVLVVFTLRFLHLRRIDNGYPGTNPLLAFMYAVLGIMIIQSILITMNIDIGMDFQTFFTRIIFALVFTVLGIFGIISGVLLDRFFLTNLKLK